MSYDETFVLVLTRGSAHVKTDGTPCTHSSELAKDSFFYHLVRAARLLYSERVWWMYRVAHALNKRVWRFQTQGRGLRVVLRCTLRTVRCVLC